MSYTVVYHALVVREDIPRLDAVIKKRIRSAIETKLIQHPEVFGIPLRHAQHGERKLRVGDYRVIFCIVQKQVRIYLIEHRSLVYKTLTQRMHTEKFL